MLEGTTRREVLGCLEKKDPRAWERFLKWYLNALILHGEKVPKQAMPLFSQSSVNVSGRVAPMYWRSYIVKDCELTAGYLDYIGIMQMLKKMNVEYVCHVLTLNRMPAG